jgi:alkanesulfonate monooxygenase SsuD/methylene tetrahydromethanopterin reductase-like flavin-dependent oxidoreductase (luciferase family)
VPRTPQGHPVVIQAGASARGKEFSARWGELIFVAPRDFDAAKDDYAVLKAGAAAAGRDPDSMKIANLFYPIVAETRAEAEDKRAAYEKLSTEMDQLSLLSEALNFDFATKGLDEAFTDDEINGIQGMQAMRDRVTSTGVKNPTVRDFMTITRRGLLHEGNTVVGDAKGVADEMERWFNEPSCDGFVIGPTHQPGTFEDFVKFVVPELQKRGIYRKDYTGSTLRDHLGLQKPDIGAWRTNYDAAE